jgi:oxygen-dependent protoporphyrinogen oxidase
MFMTLRGGLQQLVDALVAQLPPQSLLLNRRITGITRQQNRYSIAFAGGTPLLADELVFCTPAFVTADLLADIEPRLAASLRAIRYVTTATVSFGYRASEIGHSLDGFGFVVPFGEGRRITACSWSSTKFNNRAAQDRVLLRAFVGGARAEALAEQSESDLEQMVREELRITMGITAQPILSKVYRWPQANPQYDVGHRERMEQIEQAVAALPGLHLAGAAYHGPGIPDCIQSGHKVAQHIAASYSISRKEAV